MGGDAGLVRAILWHYSSSSEASNVFPSLSLGSANDRLLRMIFHPQILLSGLKNDPKVQ